MKTIAVVIPTDMHASLISYCNDRSLTTSQATRLAISRLLRVANPTVVGGRPKRVVSDKVVAYKRKGESK